jgi:hypothetical protein
MGRVVEEAGDQGAQRQALPRRMPGMATDAVIGVVVLACALLGVAYLVLSSRRRINRIAGRGARSAREILHDDP